MSDQPSAKPSAADAPKHFAIPSRPSTAPAAGQNASSWKIADQPERQSPASERTQAGSSDKQPSYEPEHGQSVASVPSAASRQQFSPEQSTSAPPSLQDEDEPTQPLPAVSARRGSRAAARAFSSASSMPGQREAERPFSSPSFPQNQREQVPVPARPLAFPVEREAERSAVQTATLQDVAGPGREQTFAPPPTFQTARTPEPSFPRPPQPPPSFKRETDDARSQGFNGNGSLPPATPASLKKSRPGRRYLYIALAIAAVVIVVGGLLSQQLLTNNSSAGFQNSALVFSGNGPYVRLPLTSDQINAIQHLSGHMKYKALANLYVAHMSLDDEIGQLIMVEYNQERYSDDLDYMLHTLHVGGVIMYEFQMTSAQQTKADIEHMQQRANIPLLISTDEEGGPYVHRLSNIYGYRMSATEIEQTGSTEVARQQGLKTSKDLAALGINEDLAPDVDVNQVNGYDMVTRTFGNTPSDVIKYAGAYLQAMQGNGTIACIKHFPGLGGALTDAHKGLPVVHSTKQEIYDIDLAPFKTFIQSPNALLNPGMIMPTDILLPAIDAKYPAELSYTFMTKILRQEFGYDGVSLTDALYMQGITNTWDMYTASVMALQAGNDMLLGANGTSQTIGVINAIKQALKDGRLTKARIDESATRIIALKMQYHLMPTYIPGA